MPPRRRIASATASSERRPSRGARARLCAAIASIALCAALAIPAAAAAGACGLIPTASIGKVFHLPHVYEGSVLLSKLPKAGGSVTYCPVLVWRGAKPLTMTRLAKKVANGSAARLAIETWAPESGLARSSWLIAGFSETLTEVKAEAGAQLLTSLHGKSFAPSPLGAEAIAYKANDGSKRQVEGIWWSPSLSKLIEIFLVESRTRSPVAHLEKIAATAVPAFGL